MEDKWNEVFENKIKEDLQELSVCRCSSQCRSLKIEIFNKEITLAGEDFGEECYKMSGKRVYEYYYKLKEEQARHFLGELRIEYGTEISIEDILQEEFSGDEGSLKFLRYCEKIGETPQLFCF